MRPRSQLAAARRGGAGACGTGARGRRRFTSRALRSPVPGAAGRAGSGAGRGGHPAPGTGSKLWRRPCGASPPARRARAFISVCAAARAPRRSPPAAARRPSRSGRPRAGLRPAPLSRRAAQAPSRLCSGCRGPAGRPRPSAAVLGAPAPLRLRCPLSPDLLSRLVSPPRAPPAAGPARRLEAGAERSAHAGVAGLRQDQLSGSEAARAARLLPSPVPPPLRSPPCLPAPPGPSDAGAPAPPAAAAAATGAASALRAPAVPPPYQRLLKSRGREGTTGPQCPPPPIPFPVGCRSASLVEWAGAEGGPRPRD